MCAVPIRSKNLPPLDTANTDVIHRALKHRILDTLAVVLVCLGNPAQPFPSSLVGRSDIIADPNEHTTYPQIKGGPEAVFVQMQSANVVFEQYLRFTTQASVEHHIDATPGFAVEQCALL